MDLFYGFIYIFLKVQLVWWKQFLIRECIRKIHFATWLKNTELKDEKYYTWEIWEKNSIGKAVFTIIFIFRFKVVLNSTKWENKFFFQLNSQVSLVVLIL